MARQSLCFFVLIFLLVTLSGCGNTDPGGVVQTTTTLDTLTAFSVQEMTTTTTLKGTTTTTTPPQKIDEKLFSMNQDISVDDLNYKITNAQTFKKMGSSMFEKKTEGKFVKVYLRITNNAKETKQIFTPRFKIEDNQGRVYERLSDDIMYIADYIEFGKQLQPGLPTSGAIVFEMPEDSKDLKLVITGDFLSIKSVKVNLDVINNLGVDTTLKQKIDQIFDESLKDSQGKMQEIMNQCNAPFKCSSNCATSSDVGQKNCPSGQVCCMVEQSEVDQKLKDLMQQSQEQTQQLLNQCNPPFTCKSSCPQYLDVGQKDCPSGELCCMG